MATGTLTPNELLNEPHNVAIPLAVSRPQFKDEFTLRTFQLVEDKALTDTAGTANEILEILTQYFYFTPEEAEKAYKEK
jgi:hypothetical protein